MAQPPDPRVRVWYAGQSEVFGVTRCKNRSNNTTRNTSNSGDVAEEVRESDDQSLLGTLKEEILRRWPPLEQLNFILVLRHEHGCVAEDGHILLAQEAGEGAEGDAGPSVDFEALTLDSWVQILRSRQENLSAGTIVSQQRTAARPAELSASDAMSVLSEFCDLEAEWAALSGGEASRSEADFVLSLIHI